MPARQPERESYPPKNKYGARKVKLDGYTFDSIREAEVYQELKLAVAAGNIRDLKVHTPFEFQLGQRGAFLKIKSRGFPKGRKVKARIDFDFVDCDLTPARRRYIDVKGKDTDVSRLKRGLIELFHGIEVEIWR